MDTIENVPEYHEVFAKSISVVIDDIRNKDPKEARKTLTFCIQFAYTQWRSETDPDITQEILFKELEKLSLEKKSQDELVIMMGLYFSKAGIKPVQIHQNRAKVFGRVRGRF